MRNEKDEKMRKTEKLEMRNDKCDFGKWKNMKLKSCVTSR